MTIEVRAPAEQSEGTRSQIVRWLKLPGESVVRDEPLIEVETDKVTVEIAAPASGVLREIVKQAQEEIAPGELLGRIEPQGARATPAPSSHPSAPAAPQAAASNLPANAGREGPAGPEGPEDSEGAAARAGAAGAVRLSPAVKRLLGEHGLEHSAVRGTGPGGRITVDDVLRHASQAPARVPTEVSASEKAPRGEARPSAPGPASGRRIAHSALRKRIAEHMVRSLLETAPHVTTVFEADFSAVLAHRASHREAYARAGAPLTVTAYILAACVGAIRAVPEANARWMEEALEVFDRIDIGVATALPERGLIVPVIRNVQDLDLMGIARELARLVGLARDDRLRPESVRGGTFTVSNHGVSGSLLAAPIVINQPQSAILGVGKVEKRAVVVEEAGAERIVARPRVFITLTIDHRVMDGHRANRFLEVLVHALETWPSE